MAGVRPVKAALNDALPAVAVLVDVSEDADVPHLNPAAVLALVASDTEPDRVAPVRLMPVASAVVM